jgi:hypothetical protein
VSRRTDDASSPHGFAAGETPPGVRDSDSRRVLSPREMALALDPALVQRPDAAERRSGLPRQAPRQSGARAAAGRSGLDPDHGGAGMPRSVDDDETIKVAPASAPAAVRQLKAPFWMKVAAAVAGVIILAGGVTLWHERASVSPRSVPVPRTAASASVRPNPPLAPVPSPAVRPSSLPAPAPTGQVTTAPGARPAPAVPGAEAVQPLVALGPIPIQTADAAQILDHVAAPGDPRLTVFRFAPNPRILVLDFQSLHDQGLMLNRVAAFAEKNGLPHDRVLTNQELADAIRASGDTVDTYYYGHDYGVDELIRFFALVEREHIQETPGEKVLRRLLRQEGWFEPDARGGLISIPRVGADKNVTMRARATILRHELSHGEYFTDPAYAAFVHWFWMHGLTAAERDRFRAHLRDEGYDPNLEIVMENESQAYLMFTMDPAFFTAASIGMTEARLSAVRHAFYHEMPPGWLRDSLGEALHIAGADRPRGALVSRP